MSGSLPWPPAAYFREEADRVDRDLTAYYRDEGPGSARYTGRLYDRYSAQSDPMRFEAMDLVAVEALSVQIPPEAAARLLLDPEAPFNSMLRAIPVDVPLWEATDALIGPGGPTERLYAQLRTLDGVDWVKASKLLAAKRPNLVPILDSRVAELVQPPQGQYWRETRAWLSQVGEVAELFRITDAAPGVSLLRRIDVALWMRATDPVGGERR